MSKRRASRQKDKKRMKSVRDKLNFSFAIRGKDSTDTFLNILIILMIGTIVVNTMIIGVAAMPNDPFGYAGGWEVQSSMNKVFLRGENEAGTLVTTNLKTTRYDIDGDFEEAVNEAGSYQDIYPVDYDDPDILVKTGYPFYLQQISSGWIESDDPFVVDNYVRKFNKTNTDGSITMVQVEYMEYAVGMSITIQTAADKYFKPMWSYFDYGYYFEDNAVETEVRAQLSLSPWVPQGTQEGWTVSGGWAGIMSISVYDVEYGLNDPGATENKGHIIQGLMSEGQAVNMFIPDTENTEDKYDLSDFSDLADPTAIQGVPSTVEFEVYAELAAGADYETDIGGHWTDCAVRNVFVTYHLKASFISTLVYELAVGHEGEIKPPPENNTVYAAEITPLSAFLEYMEGLVPGFQNILILIVVGIFGFLMIILIIKFMR